MHETGGHPGAGGIGDARRHLGKEPGRQLRHRRVGIHPAGKMTSRRVTHQRLDPVGVVQISQALKAADPDMAVRQLTRTGSASVTARHGAAGPRRSRSPRMSSRLTPSASSISVARISRTAPQRQPPVGRARERRGPDLGAKIERPPVRGDHLREQEAALIAKLGL